MFFQDSKSSKKRKTIQPDESEKFFNAIFNNEIRIVENLLNKRDKKEIIIDLDYKLDQVKTYEFDGSEAYTLLGLTIIESNSTRNLQIAMLLIEKGADVNKSGKYAKTPLQISVHLFLDRAYNVNDYQTQVYNANDYQAVIELLLKSGADPNLCTNRFSVISEFLLYKSKEINNVALKCFKTLCKYGFRYSLFGDSLNDDKKEALDIYNKYAKNIKSKANIKRAALLLCLAKGYNSQPLARLPLNIIKQIASMVRDEFCHNAEEALHIAETTVKKYRKCSDISESLYPAVSPYQYSSVQDRVLI